nr:translation initiation factor IF-2-like [Macaca fascicularis]
MLRLPPSINSGARKLPLPRAVGASFQRWEGKAVQSHPCSSSQLPRTQVWLQGAASSDATPGACPEFPTRSRRPAPTSSPGGGRLTRGAEVPPHAAPKSPEPNCPRGERAHRAGASRRTPARRALHGAGTCTCRGRPSWPTRRRRARGRRGGRCSTLRASPSRGRTHLTNPPRPLPALTGAHRAAESAPRSSERRRRTASPSRYTPLWRAHYAGSRRGNAGLRLRRKRGRGPGPGAGSWERPVLTEGGRGGGGVWPAGAGRARRGAWGRTRFRAPWRQAGLVAAVTGLAPGSSAGGFPGNKGEPELRCYPGPERPPQVDFRHVGLSRREKRHLRRELRTPRTNLRLRGHIHLTTCVCVCVWRGMGGEESCRTQIPSFQQLPERSRMSRLYLSSLIFCANCFIKLPPHFKSSSRYLKP